jgi:hypothetical protein
MPPRNLGILSMQDMLRNRFQTPVQLGLDTIARSLQADLAIHNRIIQDLTSTFAVTTADRRRRYGVSSALQFLTADEFTRAHTQKVITGSEVEFPMEGFQAAIGWTAQFFQNKTVADMAATQVASKVGHINAIKRRLQLAIFGATNYTFQDYRVDEVNLDVKRFLNADGAPIPMGPNGEQFTAGTHTHYLFSDGITNTSAHALVNTVFEHHNSSGLRVYINIADESAWRALADFKPYVDTRIVPSVNADRAAGSLDPFNPGNRAIGIFGPAEVWVKPWGVANYAVCLATDTDLKPLAMRTRDGGAPVLRTVATNVLFPLQADYMESEFGVGTWTRTNGAVLFFGAGAVAYVEPTFPI